MRQLLVVDAGVVAYDVACDWMRELHRQRVADEVGDVLLMLEHPHVYSMGRSFIPEHLIWDDESLRRRGIALHEADRGGSITYHGPGQLIAYPIVDLRRPGQEFPDAIKYLRTLEEAVIRTVRRFGLVARRREGMTGVWVGDLKLASIGVNISRGVSKHGLAINVGTDLKYFDGMVPCGMPEVAITSMERMLGRPVSTGEVIERLAKNLGKTLHLRTVFGDVKHLGLRGPGSASNVVELRAAADE
ncbi:MAG: lipoyl(octanoyl) transferase LipB [Actinomycetota bacterium]